MDDWQSIIADYLLHVRATRTDSTATFYASRLGVFSKWIAARDVQIEEFRMRHLSAYLAERKQLGTVGANTLRHDAMAVRTFVRWCYTQGVIDADVLARMELPAGEVPSVAVPTQDEVRKMIAAITERQAKHRKLSVRRQERDFLRDRDMALFCVLIECGLRISEAISLRVVDWDEARAQLTIRPGKTHKPRTIPVSAELAHVISNWMRRRPATETDSLLITVYGDTLKADSVREWLTRVQADAGVPHYSLHSLRHYALSELVHRASVLVAREVAGHASLATTNRYASLHPDMVRAGVEQAGTLGSILRQARPQRAHRRKVI